MYEVDGKTAVVTGAASGIGLGMARSFAAAGMSVVLSDIDAARGESAAEAIQAEGGDVIFVKCDVGEKAEVDALVASSVAAFGRLDCAVANAGIVHACDFLELAEEDLKLRGSGELLGTRQSGFGELRALDPVADLELLLRARTAVKNEV